MKNLLRISALGLIIGSFSACPILKNTICKVVNASTSSITITAMTGYVENSSNQTIPAGQSAAIVSQSVSIGETLTFYLTIAGNQYTATSPYVQDYSNIILTISDGLLYSLSDAQGHSLVSNLALTAVL